MSNTIDDIDQEAEMQQIPYYLREKVAGIIDQKVESKVQQEMSGFKEEVMRELEDQRMQNQMHIAHYLEHPMHKGVNTAKYNNYNGYAPGYAHGNQHMYGGHPLAYQQKREGGSKSPVRNTPLQVQREVDNQPLASDAEGAAKNFSIRQPYNKKMKVYKSGQKAPPMDKWDGYLTSNTAQGSDNKKMNVIQRRKEYAD